MYVVLPLAGSPMTPASWGALRERAGVCLSHFSALGVIGLAVALDEELTVAEEFMGDV